MQERTLIIFSRPPIIGKVKTRIAKVLGDEVALRVHKVLFTRTWEIAKGLSTPIQLYLSSIPNDNFTIHHKLQIGEDLGQRMSNAIGAELSNSKLVCLIGSDCKDITANDIDLSFQQLAHYDVVLGPAADGGYYLIALKAIHQELFAGINWGTSTVLKETISICSNAGLSYHLLKLRHDVDEAEDIPSDWLLE